MARKILLLVIFSTILSLAPTAMAAPGKKTGKSPSRKTASAASATVEKKRAKTLLKSVLKANPALLKDCTQTQCNVSAHVHCTYAGEGPKPTYRCTVSQ